MARRGIAIAIRSESRMRPVQILPQKLSRLWELTMTMEFHDSRLEWRRLFGEVFGTFFLVVAAAGAGVVNAVSQGAVGRVAAVAAPGAS